MKRSAYIVFFPFSVEKWYLSIVYPTEVQVMMPAWMSLTTAWTSSLSLNFTLHFTLFPSIHAFTMTPSTFSGSWSRRKAHAPLFSLEKSTLSSEMTSTSS